MLSLKTIAIVTGASSGRIRHSSILGQFMSLVTELERLADALSGTADSTSPLAWSSVAERIAKNLGVKADEVGILALSTKWRHLYFLAPEALKNVGFIPLSSNSALAARTARESRPEIDNSFANARHVTVFEGVRTVAGEPGEPQHFIRRDFPGCISLDRCRSHLVSLWHRPAASRGV